MNLYDEWLALKRVEQQSAQRRREIEDLIAKELEMNPEMEGAQIRPVDGYKIKAVGRITRKVDGDKLQEIAAEHGLTDQLGMLFRWSPSINAALWKAAHESITNPLSEAITAKPGRLSFTIEKNEE